VFANLSLFRCHAGADARVKIPEQGQCFSQGGGRILNHNATASLGEFTQCAGNVKGHGHDHLLVPRESVPRELVSRDLLFNDFAREEIEGEAFDAVLDREEVDEVLDEVIAELRDASCTNAVRMQTTAGNPSRIFCHVFPSSREPKICPFRVPK
jgi:hypothetical protein